MKADIIRTSHGPVGVTKAGADFLVKTDEMQKRREFVDGIITKLTGRPFDMKVAGYKVALYLPRGDEKIGSVIIPDSARDGEVLKANVGLCLALGPDAYADKERYPSGPWCLPGDWVVFQRYETTAALMGYRGIHIAMIPDDKIDGVVPDRMDVTDIKKRDLL